MRLRRRGFGGLLGALAVAGGGLPVAGAPGVIRAAEWEAFKALFMTDQGRVVDTGNGGRSHSEGQGFAMVLATAFDDPRAFLKLWHWTRTRLQTRDDALLAWLWEPAEASVTDANNATDGDLFVAWALLRAARRWGETAWLEAAAEILAAVAESCVVPHGDGRLLLPGADGFVHDDHVVVNPSYWVYPAFAAFEAAEMPGAWGTVAHTGLALVDGFAATGTGLVPDWCAIGETIGPAPDLSFAFGFDAVRVPLYLRWAYPPNELRRRLAPYARHTERFPSLGAVPARLDLASGEVSPYPMSLGGQAILLLAEHGLRGGDLALPLHRDTLDYYASVLLLLTKLAATEMPR
jgi:endoglucanase